ncbi:MAG TPA: tail fiber protein [Vicinamibacterales bacterium]|jgi:microcystin-dependent protein
MSSPYVGEIRIFAGNFAPVGWAFCEGQLMPIAENETLFNLIGTTYGGDGQETFALPDLRGRFPNHQGQGPGGSTYTIGEMTGTETETLTVAQLPIHTHQANAAVAGNDVSPAGNLWAADVGGNTAAYSDAQNAEMAAGAIGPVGGSQPHDNVQPFLAINYIISLFGVFPTQS